MQRTKGVNLVFILIAAIIGLTLFKHIDFKSFTLKYPVLDSIYILVFVILICLLLKAKKK